MDNITLGHWLFALIGSGIYILYCLWGYKKEHPFYKKFIKRFHDMEKDIAKDNKQISDYSSKELESLWKNKK